MKLITVAQNNEIRTAATTLKTIAPTIYPTRNKALGQLLRNVLI